MKTFLELSQWRDRICSRESCWEINSWCVWQVSGPEALSSQDVSSLGKGLAGIITGSFGATRCLWCILSEGKCHPCCPAPCSPALSSLGLCGSGFGALHWEGLWHSSAGSHWKVTLPMQRELCKAITTSLTTFWPPPYISAGLPLLLSEDWGLLWGTSEGTVTHLQPWGCWEPAGEWRAVGY